MKKSEDMSVRSPLKTYSNLSSNWVQERKKKATSLRSESNKKETISSLSV